MVSKLPPQTNRTNSKTKGATTKENSSPPSVSSREQRPAQTSSTPIETSAKSFYLRTKLLPPRPAPASLTRPRLLERLEANLLCAVTLVTANAGSGKTTLVADFVRARQHPFVWYQLDQTDSDPGVFLGYIAHGLGLKISGCGEATLAYLRQAATEIALHPERAADVFINEILDRVDRQIIIVLDDYHLLNPASPVHRMVDRLLAYLPEVLHVIIISRDVPPLSFARLRTQNALAIIDRLDLLFTDTEIQQLFHDVFGLTPSPAQLAEYRERTHGWITALQLIHQVAQRRHHQQQSVSAASPDLSEVLRQSEHEIFNFFAEQVFALEPPEVQNFLLRISLLDGVQPEVCAYLSNADGDAVTTETNCAPVLVELVRRNVFITLATDEREAEEYRLHPMFQSFLRKRLSVEIGAAQVANQHTRFADFYLAKNRWEQAFQHLTVAGHFDRAAELLAAHGASWLSVGALSTLAASAASLPPSSLAAHPRAIIYQAEVARLRGELPFAQSLFRRAASLLNERTDTEGEAEALHSLAAIARRQGNYEEAHHHLDAAVKLSDERSPVRIKCGNTRGACFVAQNLWTDAESAFRGALRLAEELGDEHYARLIAHNLGMPAVLRGDFDEALRWLRRLLPNENQVSSTTNETTKDKHPVASVPQEATAHLNVARCHLYRGDFVLCESHLDAALECCQQFNLLALRGEIFETYGALYRKQNQNERAAEAYERAARLYEDTDTDITRRELIEEQALLALQNGDTEAARAMLERLADRRRAHGDEWLIHSTSLALGRVLLAEGKHTEAEKLLRGALDFFRQHQLNYTEAQTCFALADCFFHLEDEAAMLEHLTRALALAARYNYGYWLKREVTRAPYLFTTEATRNLLPPDARQSLGELLSTAQPNVGQPLVTQPHTSHPSLPELPATSGVVVTAPPSNPVDLTINLLGHLEIMREPTRPFAADAWVTKRARDILCFIASRKHRRASKDVIQDTFWRESDFDHIEKNFHPTISHIRKALNSNQPLKQNFLLFRDGDYQLNPEFSYRIDIEDFDRLVEAGDAELRARHTDEAVEFFERALELYRGEFMQGFYDNWIDEQRSYYRAQHLRIAKTLIAARQKNEQWAHSLQLANAILRDDPFHEDVHCMVMQAHAALGDRLAVKGQYDSLTRILREELGIEPGIETQSLYHRLFN